MLLNTPRPLTLDAIANQVPGYPAEHAARRQAFERDKRLLRDEGIPVVTKRLEGAEQYGYLIERDSFYLPDLELEADEQVALHLAVAGVHLGDPSGRDALMKLGASGLSDVRPVAALVPSADLIELYEAVRTRATASFGYRGEPRRVAPVGLRFRFGHWYLVAWDLERAAVREPSGSTAWTARWRGVSPAVPTCPSTSTSTPRCPTSRGRPRARTR